MSSGIVVQTIEALRRVEGLVTIELAGFPKTGKSLFAEALRGMLETGDITVSVAPRDVLDCPITDKWSLDYSLWTVATVLKGILDTAHRKGQVVIADRGLVDALLWMSLKEKRGIVSSRQAERFRDFVECPGVWPERLIVVAFTSSDLDELLRRGDDRKLHGLESRVTTVETLRALETAIGEERERVCARGVPYYVNDVAEKSVREGMEQAAELVEEGLRALARRPR